MKMLDRKDYIDGLKGFAIVSVILLHSLPGQFLHDTFAYLHIWQAIPLFVFISFYLIFNKVTSLEFKGYYKKQRWKALFERIVYPFIVAEILILFFLIYKGDWNEIKHFLYVGGFGKGSYYPYLYFQLWVFAPIIYHLLNKLGIIWGGIFFVVITVSLNFVLIDIPGRFYSCFFVRYLFMGLISFVWLKKRNCIYIYLLPIISIFYWVLLESNIVDLSLLVPGWASQQFPAFFYTYLFVYVFFNIYRNTSQSTFKDFIEWLGKNSYEIFLMQMLFFYFFPADLFGFGENLLFIYFLYPAIALFSSIIPVFVYRKSCLF